MIFVLNTFPHFQDCTNKAQYALKWIQTGCVTLPITYTLSLSLMANTNGRLATNSFPPLISKIKNHDMEG